MHTALMTEQYHANTQSENHFPGQYINILLQNDDGLTEQLNNKENVETYLHCEDEDNLPYPVKRMTLISFHDYAEDLTNLEASVAFRPTDLENANMASVSWIEKFRSDLSELLMRNSMYEPVLLSHDPTALYIPIDSLDCVRIAMQPTATECEVIIDVKSIQKIEEAAHTTFPKLDESTHEHANLEILRHITTLLVAVTDQLRTSYGKPPSHAHTYTIEQQRPSKELAILDRQTNIPESEQVTSQGLESVGGATAAKLALQEIAAALSNPEKASEFGLGPRHFILHGPPGTGKTSLVHALEKETNATLWTLNTADVIDRWVGSSGQNLKDTFAEAKSVPGKLILFMDGIDALIRANGNRNDERTDVLKILNTEIEDVTENHPNIIFAGATNVDIDDLEPAIVRSGRFETIGVPIPTEQERADIWGAVFIDLVSNFTNDIELTFDEYGYEVPSEKFIPYDLKDIDLQALAINTDGMTGADFKLILKRACWPHFMHFTQTGEKNQVTQNDILKEIRQFYQH